MLANNKPRRVFHIVALILIVIVLALAASFRKEMLKVPRIRVGPLTSEVVTGDSLRLAVLGDTGTGDENQHAVAAAMEARCRAHGFDAILLLGDNFYPHGVKSLEDPQWQTKLVEAYGSECLSELPIFPVLGNHDYQGNPAAQVEYSLLNPRWRMPNRFYAVRFGSLLHLVAYDSQMNDVCLKPAFCSIDFVFERIKYRDATWTMVMGHHPLEASTGKGFGHSGGARRYLFKPFLCGKVDAYLAGHVHHLEHRVDEDCNLDMYISGGGGGDLYPVNKEKDATTRFVRNTYGFLEIELNRREMHGRFINTKGEVVYESKREQ